MMPHFQNFLTGNESPNQIVVEHQKVGGRCLSPPPPPPLANLENLTRWVSLWEYIEHEFPTKPFGCFIKPKGGGLIKAGPPEAFSLKALSRQHHNVCIIPLHSPENTSITFSAGVDIVCEGMRGDD